MDAAEAAALEELHLQTPTTGQYLLSVGDRRSVLDVYWGQAVSTGSAGDRRSVLALLGTGGQYWLSTGDRKSVLALCWGPSENQSQSGHWDLWDLLWWTLWVLSV